MRQFHRRISYMLHKRRLEAELAEEMEFHRSMTTGASFGSAPLARDRSRDVWILPWLQDIAQDVRFAARLLAKDRRFSLAAIAALALGIGANTTVFTFINAALFKDLPFPEPQQLVALGGRDARGRDLQVSYADFQDWRDAARAFADMSASAHSPMNVSEQGLAPQRLRGAYLSGGTFDMLRVKPILGRGFAADDERPGAAAVLIIGHDIWLDRYGGSPSVIGRAVRVNDVPAIIIGVMPRDFRFPMIAQAWQPLTSMPGITTARRDARTIGVTARLRPDVTIEQARSELTALADRLAHEYPDTNHEITATIARPLENMRRFARPMLLTMLGAVGFVLLIGCANVATLMLARAASRAQEIAIRSSLGATRWRVVRQLSIESVLLAMLAGSAGLLLSFWGVRYFGVAFNALEIGVPGAGVPPYWLDLTMDRTVFAFVAVLCLGSSMLFGLAPALHISKTRVNDLLKEGGRGASASLRVRRWTGGLLIGELALALILLSGAGLLVRSFVTHYFAKLPIDTRQLVVARTELPQYKYPTAPARKAFLERLDERLAGRRGVVEAAVAGDIPLVPLFAASRTLAIEGRPPQPGEKPPSISHVFIGRHYFETTGLRLIQGRAFTPADGAAGQETVIVSQRFATMFFPGGGALGRRIRLVPANAQGPPPPWITIVGVAPTVPEVAIREADPPLVYLPLRGEASPGRSISVIVHSNAALDAIASWLREHVGALDADLPLYYVQPMDVLVAQTRYPLRMMGTLFGLLAVIGVVLVSVGLFALTAHGVAQRTREIGIRKALGARAHQVVWMFLQRTLVQLLAGIVLGLAGALSVGKLVQAYLVHTEPRDPLTLACISLLLACVALTAALLPARRAARVDPVVALRYE
jgi:putative ABC transport system permease protein